MTRCFIHLLLCGLWLTAAAPLRAEPLPLTFVSEPECATATEPFCGPLLWSPDDGTLFRWAAAPDVSGGPDRSEPLATDRPDFTESSVTVGRGVTQIESGYTLTSDEDAGARIQSHSFGEFLIRHGVGADWLELRLAFFPAMETTRAAGDTDSTGGMEDLYLGAKFALTPQAGWLPEMALVPQMTVPTGSSHFSSDHLEPGVNWLYGWDINDTFSTAGSTQVNRRIDGLGDSYAEFAQSWTVGASLADEVGMYAEWFAFFPAGSDDARTEHYFDGGFTVLLTDDIQWDIRAGVGLNDAAADYFAGMGLSIRFR